MYLEKINELIGIGRKEFINLINIHSKLKKHK